MTTLRWSAAALAVAAVLGSAGEASAQMRGGFRGGMPMMHMTPMMMGPGTFHMTPRLHTPFGSTAGFRTHGLGRLTSPGVRGTVTVPPQFAARPFSSPQAFRGTPEAAQFRSSMRQFDAFRDAQLRAAQLRTTPFGTTPFGTTPFGVSPLSVLSGLGIF